MILFLCKHYAPPGVIPYLPYSTHCILRRRGCVTAKLLASMMAKSGREEGERERDYYNGSDTYKIEAAHDLHMGKAWLKILYQLGVSMDGLYLA